MNIVEEILKELNIVPVTVEEQSLVYNKPIKEKTYKFHLNLGQLPTFKNEHLYIDKKGRKYYIKADGAFFKVRTIDGILPRSKKGSIDFIYTVATDRLDVILEKSELEHLHEIASLRFFLDIINATMTQASKTVRQVGSCITHEDLLRIKILVKSYLGPNIDFYFNNELENFFYYGLSIFLGTPRYYIDNIAQYLRESKKHYIYLMMIHHLFYRWPAFIKETSLKGFVDNIETHLNDFKSMIDTYTTKFKIIVHDHEKNLDINKIRQKVSRHVNNVEINKNESNQVLTIHFVEYTRNTDRKIELRKEITDIIIKTFDIGDYTTIG